jgi:hypothetical protein
VFKFSAETSVDEECLKNTFIEDAHDRDFKA